MLAADSTAMGTQLLVDALAREPQFDVIESASNAAAVLQLIKREQAEVALVSARMGKHPGAGYEVVRHIRAESPATRIIMLLDASERGTVVEAFRAGAHGVFCRTEPFRLLAKCIECVHQGQVWASSTELQFLLEALAQPDLGGLRDSPLSARETDVVRCVTEGLTNREIAHRLKLTEHTVKNYLFRIFDKLGVSSRVEVVLYALGNGEHRNSTLPHASKPHTDASGRKIVRPAPIAIRKTAT
ncbi:MAG TPA: response regulator transcription factor [Candidatus Acidoferrales bacterium]|nr:response regulator transcription factor [Candidatus Acidoferrales bacterium]